MSSRYRILILMCDTGGGHRASADALGAAIEFLYPKLCHITIIDLWTEYGVWPFNSFVPAYKYLCKNPRYWGLLYDYSKNQFSRKLINTSGYVLCDSQFRKLFLSIRPHLICSLHPLCQHVPLKLLKDMNMLRSNISHQRTPSMSDQMFNGPVPASSSTLYDSSPKKNQCNLSFSFDNPNDFSIRGQNKTNPPVIYKSQTKSKSSKRHSFHSIRRETLATSVVNYSVPFVTVVTDLGGAHPTWFSTNVDRCYVPSKVVEKIALSEGLNQSQIRQYGLPIRQEFWTNDMRKKHNIRIELCLAPDRPTCLIVGGGDGVGDIEAVTTSIIESLSSVPLQQFQIIVICGNNTNAKRQLEKQFSTILCSFNDQDFKKKKPSEQELVNNNNHITSSSYVCSSMNNDSHSSNSFSSKQSISDSLDLKKNAFFNNFLLSSQPIHHFSTVNDTCYKRNQGVNSYSFKNSVMKRSMSCMSIPNIESSTERFATSCDDSLPLDHVISKTYLKRSVSLPIMKCMLSETVNMYTEKTKDQLCQIHTPTQQEQMLTSFLSYSTKVSSSKNEIKNPRLSHRSVAGFNSKQLARHWNSTKGTLAASSNHPLHLNNNNNKTFNSTSVDNLSTYTQSKEENLKNDNDLPTLKNWWGFHNSVSNDTSSQKSNILIGSNIEHNNETRLFSFWPNKDILFNLKHLDLFSIGSGTETSSPKKNLNLDQVTNCSLVVKGFVSNMDEWMTASDMIITKAGPGTIAEACSRGLPVLLFCYLPGQEEGNVDFVLDGKFGAYSNSPFQLGKMTKELLTHPEKLNFLSKNAKLAIDSKATCKIAKDIIQLMLSHDKKKVII